MKRLILVVLLFLHSSVALAEILFQDPTGKELNAAFDALSEEQVKNLSPPRVSEKQYLLGLLYLNGDEEFHVEQNCQKAFELLTDAWEGDVVDAGHALATMYYHGVCTEENVDMARELATQAAQEGYILAQRMLGMAYVGADWEELYPYNIEEGIFWLSEAGNAGDMKAAAHLAGMYDSGDGVPKSEKKYFEWLKKAVFTKFEERNIAGFPALANCYETGKGTDVNLTKAYKYYDLSGSAGVEDKQRIADQMTQDQIDEAVRQSQAWQEEHNVRIGGGFIRRAN
ncbi:tetratricopeptide repeat protein [Salinicola aestuarinus]|uniref:tetratricopeptide repeat protein n=1 Tax=Salinicola aestuarinus TaxID=1949082 RepID=UPI000DA1A6B7|nr:tetratricopeptide repeat protein [Salinicola aestuarinus]